MKNLFIMLIAIPIVIFLFACDTLPKYTELELLREEVMAIHDSVMPQMTKIYYDKENLEEWLEQSGEDLDESLKLDLKTCIRDLKVAEDAMWKWMSDYDDLTEKIKNEPDSIQMVYLLDEKKSIIHVRDLMLSSMSRADQLLKQKK